MCTIGRMDLNHLKAFLSVADCGSFSIAAERMHLTQPAISKRIAALEQQLNANLFDRIARQVHLTEAGEALLPVARAVCTELERIQQTIASLNSAVGGKLSLGTSHHIGLHRMPALLLAFTAEFPEVEMDLHFMDSDDACLRVENGTLELAVVTLPGTRFQKLEAERVWTDPLAIACNHDHPLHQEREITPAVLANHPAVVSTFDTVTRQVLDQALLSHDVRLKVALETNYMETIKMMVSVGLGWSAIPEIMLSDELTPLDVPGMQLSRELGFVRHKKRSLSSAAQAFITLLREHADP